MSLKNWKILHSTYLIQTPYMNLRRDAVQLPNGNTMPDYHVVEERDYGMVFALTPAQEVVLVRQYKHGIGEITLELPAGYFDPQDTDPAAGCMREFREETGYDTPHYTLVGKHITHPTRHANCGHLVVATHATPTADGQHLDPAEQIDVVPLPVPQVLDLIQSGEIYAVSTVASIYFGLDYLQRRGGR